ncbi:hypothetical protein F9C07_1507981 [Aspergillus flavus]|uniref:Uncharacterized protein n=1 Tax=Aspergillus flavus (strain ATCC 200026 / FGSC A1120 / IAM 13836 / NRRL 3357 / JCM 12722 / SRRC 167) TaxID=332952 RepID=A0A7U2QZC1_ASPFN|nr:hypothetical protein F9C07_1507981 [Aspergillus flavus]
MIILLYTIIARLCVTFELIVGEIFLIRCPSGMGKKFFLILSISKQKNQPKARWPSGLRRWSKVPVSKGAWVQIPLSSTSFLLFISFTTVLYLFRACLYCFLFSLPFYSPFFVYRSKSFRPSAVKARILPASAGAITYY